MPEEVDLASFAALGNVPLVWSHMEAARALHLIGVARRRQRLGPIGFAAWQAGRFVVDRARRAP